MDERLCSIALSQISKISLHDLKHILDVAHSASVLFENQTDIQAVVPDINPNAVNAFKLESQHALEIAKYELDYAENKGIKVLNFFDGSYPDRLRECHDAPVVLFYLGNANLNTCKVISIVGTRHCSQYGKDICRLFISDLQRYYPDVLIVSGLAYGVDINAHKAALDSNMPTVGVLAHGLDRIYPTLHRQVASNMTNKGGLLTEYITGTTPERINFLRRNRIIAGMSDCTIVVESASHGGSLVTADLATSYHREVMAFPGRVYDRYSEGCNKLIIAQKAIAIQNAEDLINAMCWENTLLNNKTNDGQMDLFVELSEDETKIIKILQECDDKQINSIVNDTGWNYSKVSSLLFELEMKGIVSITGGAHYRLVK